MKQTRYSPICSFILITFYIISCQQHITSPENSLNSNPGQPESATTVFTIYMSAKGNDANSGIQSNQPVKTLSRVQNILKKQNPQVDVNVMINNDGVYYGDYVRWTYVNGKKITFRAQNFDDPNPPVFSGDGKGIENWFLLDYNKGSNSNLSFRYLKIEKYNCAIYFWGVANDSSRWNGGNYISACTFQYIGTKYSGRKDTGYGAVRFVNSRNNVIVHSEFVSLNELTEGRESHLHAVYFADYSSHNQVYSCNFSTICGDPFRVRNYSNYNSITSNNITRCGKYAYFSDYRLNNGKKVECRSYENEFKDNNIHCGFDQKEIKLFEYFYNYLGSDGKYHQVDDDPSKNYPTGNCTSLTARLHTLNNIRSCP